MTLLEHDRAELFFKLFSRGPVTFSDGSVSELPTGGGSGLLLFDRFTHLNIKKKKEKKRKAVQ